MLAPISKNALDVEALKRELIKLEIGTAVSYRHLSALIGRDIQKARYLLDSACNQLLSERRMVFGVVFNVGIKRLTADEAVNQASHVLRRVRGIARRGAARIAAADYTALSSDDLRRMHNSSISLLAAILHSADTRHLNRLSEACTNTAPSALPTAQTLKLLAS